MNRLYLVVSVLFALIHGVSWGMLTVGSIQNSHKTEKLFTQEKLEKEAQMFLSNFGRQSINETGELFCNLSLGCKQKVVSKLSYNQNVLVWFGAKDLDIPILTIICNGNENVAHMYRNEPINKVLQDSARAEDWQKFGRMSKHHFMLLKNSQIRLCEDVFLESTILASDLPKFMDALQKLKRIESEFDIKAIMDFIKIYPSLAERVAIFYQSAPLGFGSLVFNNTIVSNVKGCSVTIPLLPFYFCMYGWKEGIKEYCKNSFLSAPTIATATIIDGLIIGHMIMTQVYPNYQNNFKNNVLPNQPTLTDYIQKHDPSIFANK